MTMAATCCRPHGQPHAPLEVVDAHAPERAGVEAFIREVYARRFGADVRDFAPVLVCLREEGRIVAAAGYRGAASGPLFLERYLPAPVESLLGPPAPDRRSVVEVGHLSAAKAGQGRRLVLELAPHLAAQGYTWVASTLTEDLRRLFLRIGILPLTLAPAHPAPLGDQAVRWGTYYSHQPVVLAGQLHTALRHIERYARATGAAG